MKILKKYLCIVLIVLLVAALSGCGGNSISEALDSENFNTVQITATYEMEDLEAEDETINPSNSTTSDGIIYNDVETDETGETGDSSVSEDLKYKRYHETYYEYAFGNEFYSFEEDGKHYRIISQPDYSSPDDFQNLWYKQETEEDYRLKTTTFNYDAFSTLEKDCFKKKGNTYTLKEEHLAEFVKTLLKMDMTNDVYSNPSVVMTVEDNKIAQMSIEFLREERYQFKINYNLIYNNLKVQLPECTDKEPIVY